MTSRIVLHARALPLAALLLSVACVPSVTIKDSQYRAWTAGVIGCPSSEIALSGQPNIVRVTPMEWRAECRGHRYVCSGSGHVVNCNEELQPITAPPSATVPAPTNPAP
jgi:hypothetical protein